MKNIILVLIFIFSGMMYSQSEIKDCKVSKEKLLNVYLEFKDSGLKILDKSGGDFMITIIDEVLGSRELTQLCINTWGDINENGSGYLYGRFKRRYNYIDERKYIKNIYYLEILSQIHLMARKSM